MLTRCENTSLLYCFICANRESPRADVVTVVDLMRNRPGNLADRENEFSELR